MRTGKLSMKVLAALLGVFLSASQAIAAAQQLPADELAQLQEKLIAAQGDIAKGNPEAGQKALDAIKQTAQEKLSTRWQFVTKLSEAVTAEKAGKQAEADAALRQAAGQAREADQFATELMVGTRLVQQFQKKGQKPQAENLVSFLGSGPAKEFNDYDVQMRLASFLLTGGENSKAEGALTKAAGLAGDRFEWERFADVTWSLTEAAGTPEEASAICKRLVPLAKTETAKTAVFNRMLREIRSAFGAVRNLPSSDRALAKLEAIRQTAGSVPGLSPDLALTDNMASALKLLQSADQAGTLKALRDANELVKDKPLDAGALYDEGKLLITKSLLAKNKPAAAEIAQFIEDGPGKQVDPRTLHMEMTHVWLNLSEFKKAEESLMAGASLVKTKVDAEMYGAWAFVVVDATEPVEAKLAALDHLVSAAPEAAKTVLIDAVLKHLGGAFSQQLNDPGFAARVRLFDAVKGMAAATPSLSARTVFVGKMFSAHTSARSGSHGDALKALQEAYEFAKDKPADAGVLYRQGKYLFEKSLAAKDKATAQGFADFLATGPGKQVDPRAFHMEMAHIWLNLRECKKAEESLVLAAPLAKDSGAADTWGREVFDLALALNPSKEGIAVFDRMAPLAASADARTVLKVWKADFSVWFSDPADAEKLVVQIPMVSPDGKPVFRAIAMRYHLATTYVIRGNIEEARRVFTEVDSAARLLPQDEALKAIEKAFGPTLRGIETGIIAGIVKGSGGQPPAYLLTAYCKAAAGSGRADEAIRLLTETKSKPSYFVVLASYLKGFGDVAHARQALDAIPKAALDADPALAKAVAEFWPADSDKVKAEIERCRSLIAAYEQRAKAARAAGEEDFAKQCDDQLKTLKERIAALEKGAGK